MRMRAGEGLGSSLNTPPSPLFGREGRIISSLNSINMNFTSTNQTSFQPEVERIKSEIKRILEMQAEIEGLERQEKEAAEKAVKQTHPFGEVADLSGILALNRISDILLPKYDVLRNAVNALEREVTPTSVYIGQHYFNTWIRIEPGLLIRFPYDYDRCGLEVREKG